MSNQIEEFEIEDESTDIKKTLKKRVVFVTVAVLIILITVFLIINRRHLAPLKFSEWISDSFARMGSGEGYPYEVNSNSVNDIASFNKDGIILTDTSLIILNPSSKEITNRQFSYSNPVMDTSSDRILIYDVGGNGFSIHNRSSLLFEGTTQNAISTCTIGDYGNFAIATRDEIHSGSVTFYSYKFKETFKWNSGNAYIVSLALSSDGDYGSAVTLNAESGNAYSTVYIFNFETEEILSYKYEDTVITNIVFGKDNCLTLIGDDGITVINALSENGDDKKYNIVGSLSFVSCDNSNAVATVSKLYENNDIYNIEYVNHKYETEFTSTIEEKVFDVYANEKKCAVLTDKSIYLYNNEGEVIYTISVSSLGADSSVSKVLLCNSELYALTSSKILKIDYN